MTSNGERLWLVGGGLERPLSYSALASMLARTPHREAAASVADILIALCRTVWQNDTFAPGELSFAGEGSCRLVPPANGAEDSHDLRMPSGDATLLLASSGSTGTPRVVRHRLQNLWRSVVVSSRHAEDIWGLAFNPSHIAGVQVFLQAVANRNTIVNLWGIDEDTAFSRCAAFNVTHLSATPTFYRLLLSAPGKLPALRSISIGGEPVDEGLLSRLAERFPQARLHNIYASTEAATLLVSDGAYFSIPDDHHQVIRIVNNRIQVHRSLLGEFGVSDEWYDTGDVAIFDPTRPGRFRISGRQQEWINVGGEKVNPHEVEAALARHPAVATSRVFGRANSIVGKILVADVVRCLPVDEPELRDALAAQLPSYKIPRMIRFVETLESTRTGKAKRL